MVSKRNDIVSPERDRTRGETDKSTPSLAMPLSGNRMGDHQREQQASGPESRLHADIHVGQSPKGHVLIVKASAVNVKD